MKAKTTFAVAVFAAIAGLAGTTLAAPGAPAAPCSQQMAAVYADLAQEMNLSGAAKTAFDKYVAARQQIAEKHYAWMKANTGKRPATREEAMKLRAEHLKNRADMLDQIAAARTELGKSLTAEQKQTLDAYEPRYGMGAGKARGMGPHGMARHHRGHGGYGSGCGYGPGFGPGCAGAHGCVYGVGPQAGQGQGWGWHGPHQGYGQYGYGPGCRW